MMYNISSIWGFQILMRWYPMSCLLSFHMRKLASLYQTTVSIKLQSVLKYLLNFTLTKESFINCKPDHFFY